MAKDKRDYPLSETPKPKVYIGAGGGGSDKEYNLGASVTVPIYKGFSVGVNKYAGKSEYGKYSGQNYNATVRIPLGKRKKN
jgi:hypothetical protein